MAGISTRKNDLRLEAACHFLAQILPRCGDPFLGSARGVVERVLQCHCGFETRAADEDELVAVVQRHAREAHQMALSREEVLLVAVRAQPNAPSTTPDTDSEEER
jgi:hypothetical protein